MEKERLTARLKIIILIIVFAGIIFAFFDNVSPSIDRSKIKTSSFIPYPSKLNYRQTRNDCGPFNTAAIVRTLKGQEINSQIFVEEMEWRLPNKYTLPWGLESQLKKNGIVIETPNVKSLSDEDKILFLQERLSLGKPVIILGEKEDFQHYMTIFGFDGSKNEFYIYDSLHDKDGRIKELTKDENASLPGNRTLSSEAVLDFWRNGGIYGIYKWYALVASTG